MQVLCEISVEELAQVEGGGKLVKIDFLKMA
jgi:bacteriocin-like protein